jgi:GWxTD domain-containing protein
MNRLAIALLFTGFHSLAQLQDINFNYLYDTEQPFSFSLQVTQQSADSLRAVYQLVLKDTAQRTSEYVIAWELFESLSDKTGVAFDPVEQTVNNRSRLYGHFLLTPQPVILAAKVTKTATKKAWYFFKSLENVSPAGGYLLFNIRVVDRMVVSPNSTLQLQPTGTYTLFYYRDNFPAATPPFSETQQMVSEAIKPDSVLSVENTITPFANGLYLLQRDTAVARGVSFRAESDYPKFTRLENLVGPLTYVTTQTESQQLLNAQRDKPGFDKVILRITGNAERARMFMRNYFRRVEQANQLFTSYKEGWKTDRGMIYIIFGLPSFVYKFTDREVWEYKTLEDTKINFTFVRSATVFDPENFVLVRKRSYQNIWLEAVDLNRNARF